MQLERRKWVPEPSENLVQNLADKVSGSSSRELLERLTFLADLNKTIHEKDCFNLNPATNVMNPRAEAFLSCGIGSRPSLGYPGDKYEMGLEAIEEIEVVASSLVAETFCSKFAEIRVPSGAMANLFSFMAICKPGDTIIVPPASVPGPVPPIKVRTSGRLTTGNGNVFNVLITPYPTPTVFFANALKYVTLFGERLPIELLYDVIPVIPPTIVDTLPTVGTLLYIKFALVP